MHASQPSIPFERPKQVRLVAAPAHAASKYFMTFDDIPEHPLHVADDVDDLAVDYGGGAIDIELLHAKHFHNRRLERAPCRQTQIECPPIGISPMGSFVRKGTERNQIRRQSIRKIALDNSALPQEWGWCGQAFHASAALSPIALLIWIGIGMVMR